VALLDSIFTINVSSQSAAPSRAGFGTALLLSYHTIGTNRVRSYSSTAGMVSDGFAVTHPAYKWATEYFAQNPSPQKLKIGRRTTAPTQTNIVTVKATPPVGAVLSFSVDGTVYTYTTTTTVAGTAATALAAAVTAALPTNVTSATVTATVNVSLLSVATKLVNVVNLSPVYLSLYNSIPDSGVAADLAAIAAEDNDWYALAIDSASDTESKLCAIYAEANKKLFVARSADDACADGTSTTDLAYILKGLSYGRTITFFNRIGGTLSYIDAAILGSRLPADPGSDTWAFKTLPGVAADSLTDSEITALKAKTASYYVSAAGVSFTQGGQVSGGQWADVVRGLDWVRSNMQIAQFALALNRPKIPFTDLGIDMVKGVVKSVGISAEKIGLFTPGSFSVSAPAAADVSALDKANRNLPGVTWTAQLAGAIHTTIVNGTTTV
jgi:hypothetical protein